MTDWQELYRSKLVTSDEAVSHIPDNCRVFFGHAANEPSVLVDALVRNYERFTNVEITHWVPLGRSEYCDPKMAGHFRHQKSGAGRPRGLHALLLSPVHALFQRRHFPHRRGDGVLHAS